MALGEAGGGTFYDASRSYNGSPRRHVLVQRTQERVMGRGQSLCHGSCQLLKTSSPPACKAEPCTLPKKNKADGV